MFESVPVLEGSQGATTCQNDGRPSGLLFRLGNLGFPSTRFGRE